MRASPKLPLPGKQYVRDGKWTSRHYKALSLEYANKWVAVYKGQVVAVGDELGRVEREARERTGALEIFVQRVDDATIIL